ncbi:CML4, partial [Symbiodinium microadriaticum]
MEKSFAIVVGDSSLALVEMNGSRVTRKRSFGDELQKALENEHKTAEMAKKAYEWPIKQLRQVQTDVQKICALANRPGINSITLISGPENGINYGLPEEYDEEMSRHAKVMAEHGIALIDPFPLVQATDRPDRFHTSLTAEHLSTTVNWYKALISATVVNRLVVDLRDEEVPPVARDDDEQIVLNVPLLAAQQDDLPLTEGEEVSEVDRILLDTTPGAENIVQVEEDDTATAVLITKLQFDRQGDEEATEEEIALANFLGIFALDLSDERTS